MAKWLTCMIRHTYLEMKNYIPGFGHAEHATKKDRDGLNSWWTSRDSLYEAFAGRQAIAEWPKLEVCDPDLSGVRTRGA